MDSYDIVSFQIIAREMEEAFSKHSRWLVQECHRRDSEITQLRQEISNLQSCIRELGGSSTPAPAA
jgi:hypothetical protein